MLADRVDYIIGVDTHKATHTAAVVTPTGAALAHRTVPAEPTATCTFTGSPSSRHQAAGSGRSRALAATGPASRPTCSSRASG